MKRKKLLILGGTNDEISIVEEAKSMEIYTIVTDNHENLNESPAKYISDEYWNISWNDIGALEKKCLQEGIDGVVAGFSEFRVDSMIKLCERLGLPCYINEHQLEITRDKIKFKQFCREHDIPVIKEYDYRECDIPFPVIIKPVDRAGSIGINVAYNKVQYDKYIEYALSLSPSKTVIVEDYIDDGMKFDCYYVINNSMVELMGTCDTIMHSKSTKGHETIQKAWMIPSLYNKDFINRYDEKFKEMIRNLGFKNGYADISCFYKDGVCYVFEAGFRLSGGHSFDYQNATSGSSYLRTIINHSLGQQVQEYMTPKNILKAVIYSLYINTPCEEKIKSIEGLNSFGKDNSIITILPKLNIGSEIKPNKPTKFAMVTILAKTFDDVRKKIDFINKNLYVKTESHVYFSDTSLSEEVLLRYWPE